MQKAIIVYFFTDKNNNLNELNLLLSEGWRADSDRGFLEEVY